MSESDVRRRLRSMLIDHAVLRGEFVLSSGARSSYYLDARRVTLSAAGSGLVGEAFLELMGDLEIDAAAGLTVGADPIVSAIAVISGVSDRPIDGLIIRKEVKTHGLERRIEGPWRAGMRVAVVEDTATTGSSALNASRAVGEAGGNVIGVYVLIDREQGAREAVESAGYLFQSLYRATDLIEA